MSAYYWRVIALKVTFVFACYVSYLRADDNVQKLPFCNPTATGTHNDLVIISTLDGRLTAFDTHNGMKAWHIETQPLLSSNLHHVELTAGGKWVRLVPSLRGTLYSLSGDTVEPLPFNADQLLSSSFKYSDDLIIAGGRETLWLGVDASSGSILYECGSRGCAAEQQTAGAGRDVLVLRRHSSTVRALDPRSGTEKWNFSVGEHQLALSRRECAGGGAAAVAAAVALPEGVVRITRPGDHQPLWQQKLDAPVAGMWRLRGGSLQNIDVLWEAARSLGNDGLTAPPSLYIGLHDRQLYIQESLFYTQKLETAVSTKPVPWKLVNTRPLLEGGHTALTPLQNPDPNTLSLITLYGNAGQTGNHGFFLYLQETCDQAVQVSEDALEPEVIQPGEEQTNPHHVHVHVYSLWFWWKEVLLIAISSALLMNLMIWPRFFAPKFRPSTPLPLNQEVIVVERHFERPSNSTEYCGRYESDFKTLRCLGKGGFGIVLEVENVIDGQTYAIKRITLPKKEEKRHRVLREVKALATLEHENIVRYYNAWVEEPPPQWQASRDALWAKELEGGSVLISHDVTTPPVSPYPAQTRRRPESVLLDMHKPVDDCFEALDFDKRLADSKRQRSLSYTEKLESSSNTVQSTTEHRDYHSRSKKTNDEDDSFIVFEDEPGLGKSQGVSSDSRMNHLKTSYQKTDGTSKKKGHRRHWSLDMVVRDGESPTKMYLYIQMQLCQRDSLYHWLLHHATWESRTTEVVKSYFSQIVSAVEYVHRNNLIHRDLKPRNILFAPDGRIKVGDFGLVTTMGDTSSDGSEPMNYHPHYPYHTKSVGTKLYMSPEQRRGERNYDFKVDIYSMGLILFELFHPFSSDHERIDCINRVRNGSYPKQFFKTHPKEMEVLKLMLSEKPELRPTATELRGYPPLHTTRWPTTRVFLNP